MPNNEDSRKRTMKKTRGEKSTEKYQHRAVDRQTLYLKLEVKEKEEGF